MLFEKNKIFGVGLKNYRVDCDNQIDPRPESIPQFCSSHPHNFFLEILSETGLVGFFIFFIFFICLIFYLKDKIKSLKNDEFLVGKYTCGAYLYMAPSTYSAVSVAGLSPSGATKQLAFGAANAIKIPLIFQFRASDKLTYIGGWRVANPTGLKNVKYSKKIGLDIYSTGSVFSFDVTVGAQYEKETAVVVPLSQLDISTFSAVGAAD